VANDGEFQRENARHSVPTATWIGHATLLVQMGGRSFLTDPIGSRTASPVSWRGRTVASIQASSWMRFRRSTSS
jgi:L-ascorbate metabolism protein UlaG (beta-lactamase superfamily)